MRDETLENYLIKNGIRKRSKDMTKKEMEMIDDSYIWSFPTMKTTAKVEHPCKCDWLFDPDFKEKKAS